MRNLLIVLSVLLFPVSAAHADVSIGIGISVPGVSIGINMPAYPRLARVPGYPVYYDPYVDSNFFFYDGLYWVFYGDDWYVSSWYNGPWQMVAREYVPVYVLRIPVRFYRRPPAYFRGWHADAPPHWGERWGRDWEHSHSGWDNWDRRATPHPAPLPKYQRSFTGDSYPRVPEVQHSIVSKKYRYQPREPVAQQYFQQQQKQQRRQPRQPEKEREDRH
ncbi:MAG: hypothetical protein WCA64_13185 [Gallionella sp.]